MTHFERVAEEFKTNFDNPLMQDLFRRAAHALDVPDSTTVEVIFRGWEDDADIQTVIDELDRRATVLKGEANDVPYSEELNLALDYLHQMIFTKPQKGEKGKQSLHVKRYIFR